MEFVAREIRFYTLFEAVYLKESSEAADQLASTLVQTYGNLLRYLAKAYRYYSKRTIGIIMLFLLSFLSNVRSSSSDFGAL